MENTEETKVVDSGDIEVPEGHVPMSFEVRETEPSAETVETVEAMSGWSTPGPEAEAAPEAAEVESEAAEAAPEAEVSDGVETTAPEHVIGPGTRLSLGSVPVTILDPVRITFDGAGREEVFAATLALSDNLEANREYLQGTYDTLGNPVV